MSSVVSAGKAALPPQQRTADITQFLQDIIGRDQVLAADSGRLREIHARIVKEVEDTKVGGRMYRLDSYRPLIAGHLLTCRTWADPFAAETEGTPYRRPRSMADLGEPVRDDYRALKTVKGHPDRC